MITSINDLCADDLSSIFYNVSDLKSLFTICTLVCKLWKSIIYQLPLMNRCKKIMDKLHRFHIFTSPHPSDYYLSTSIIYSSPLYIRVCQQFYSKIFNIKNLKLNEYNCTKFIDGLILYPNLNTLEINDSIHLNNLSYLKYCKKLSELNHRLCYHLVDISGLQQCPFLKILRLKNCSDLIDISPINYCPHLIILSLTNCFKIRNFSSISTLQYLTDLSIKDAPYLTNLSFIKNLPILQEFNLINCPNLNNLSPISYCLHLTSLLLSKCDSITNLYPLITCNKLTYFAIYQCPYISKSQFYSLKYKIHSQLNNRTFTYYS